jgi:phage-related tail protein
MTTTMIGSRRMKPVVRPPSNGDLAEAIRDAARLLGTNDAFTSMGGLESVGAAIKNAGEANADALKMIADSLGTVASAMEDMASAIGALETPPITYRRNR